jgi:putative nucleotidyltransferase with HDIG domain
LEILDIPNNRFDPYESLRLSFFVMVTHKARIVRRLRSWAVRKDYLQNIIKLAKLIDANDTYTRGHSCKVMKHSIHISRNLGLTKKETKLVKTASILHDIGKIGIDLDILRKEEKLSDEDWNKIRLHPDIGATIVRDSGFLNEAIPMIRHHHASYSGGGYPDPDKRKDSIPLGSRIIAVADAFDAMTSDRPYRKGLPREAAVEELKRCTDKQFDPEIVDAFLTSDPR